MLLAVYAMLAHVGALSGVLPGDASANGAAVLTRIVSALFRGEPGSVLLAVIFIVACFNVCVGLISSCGEFFHTQFPGSPTAPGRSSSPRSAWPFQPGAGPHPEGLRPRAECHLSGGHRAYPAVLFQRLLRGRRRVYPMAILCTGIASVVFALADAGAAARRGAGGAEAAPLAGRGAGLGPPGGPGRWTGTDSFPIQKKETYTMHEHEHEHEHHGRCCGHHHGHRELSEAQSPSGGAGGAPLPAGGPLHGGEQQGARLFRGGAGAGVSAPQGGDYGVGQGDGRDAPGPGDGGVPDHRLRLPLRITPTRSIGSRAVRLLLPHYREGGEGKTRLLGDTPVLELGSIAPSYED